jgi:hypothetical protein
MRYELSQPVPARNEGMSKLLPAGLATDPAEAKWPSLQPWQRKASRKAVERYADAQEKKWGHWNEAMFEPDGRKQQRKKPSRESV